MDERTGPTPAFSIDYDQRAAERRRRKYKAARKARQRQRTIQTLTLAFLAFALGAGIGSCSCNLYDGQEEATEAKPSTASTASVLATVTPAIQETQEPVRILAEVSLDPETQGAIYSLCDEDNAWFCAVMAIAAKESGYQTDAIGDGGKSVGMMQINTKWHTQRMADLGVTDLTDPVQCAAVGLDYLQELSDRMDAGTDSDALYMAYNMGAKGASELISAGTTSSAYSREVLATYQEYMSEVAGNE